MEDLKLDSFEDQLKRDLEKRDEKMQKLATMLKADGDAVEVNEGDLEEIAQTALGIISDDQSIIKAMAFELRDEKEAPVRFQERIDENLVAQIEHWKNQFEWLQQRFQQYQRTHF